MKKHFILALFFILALVLFTGQVYAHSEKMRSQTGKVTAIDPEGKAIVIKTGEGSAALDVGAVIEPDTVLMIKGKEVPLSDLQNNIYVGDMVTVKYIKTNDLYAKQIVKR